MTPPAIELSNITKTYSSHTALDAVDMTVEDGEIFGFLGPNGAGKSTTIAILMNYTSPTSGTARVLGLDPQSSIRELHQQIGILPDRYSCYDNLTGYAHLKYAIDVKHSNDDPDKLLDRVGLGDVGAKTVGEYSQGMQQRLAVAMALVGSPELLILDEPFTGLDPEGARLIREIVYTENERGTTVFFSSHVLGQVALVCDRVGVLNAGQIVATGSVDDLRQETGVSDELIFETTDRSKSIDLTLDDIDGILDVSRNGSKIHVKSVRRSNRRSILESIENSGISIETFSVREASVEEIFNSLVGN